ncbi:nagb/rpia/CoA transferase-like protein [Basidiobolus meristosporus CBS 931.73]|uniref:Nagb/rpia/CoA transferase-like protein n=1 Tax=Basidiobolus meristosporus CBS 931.73 TaxID=1314790 RepID=A0A1Y1YZR6_9FUNG|nr:nagb/rpia/CoA transferase-like protein [Basidiobolus meristosporus CBS 931.73]|eukprot:ORY03354.1 nagb/rpia/CoA transferase-like protein [Basidiobolus meristosporus CBS 931.73]
MKKRQVVTSFIVVDSFAFVRNHWAGVSGSIEEQDKNPLERALTEIKEELALNRDSVALIRPGKPLTFLSKELETEWTVFPFLFRLLVEPNQIQLDFEHVDKKWIKVEELSTFETVPNLREALERVYLPEFVHKGLIDMSNDRNSGAQQLADKALEVVRQLVVSKALRGDNISIEGYLEKIRIIGWHLVKIRPSMQAAISSTLSVVYNTISQATKEGDISLDIFEKQVSESITTFRRESRESLHKLNVQFLATLFSPLFAEASDDSKAQHYSIMTISYSSTVFGVFCMLCHQVLIAPIDHKLDIYIMESRPLNEGSLGLAAKLDDFLAPSANNPKASARIRIQVITDASCAYFMPKMTHVLLGADHISGVDGSVVNKIGSLNLALAAKHFDKKVHVVSRLDKVYGVEEEEVEENEPVEVFVSYGGGFEKCLARKRVEVRNIYFDKVTPDLIDGYITENGHLLLEDIQSFWGDRQKLVTALLDL